jgi:leucyl/phenylalanyl-tRNA--protein transferase
LNVLPLEKYSLSFPNPLFAGDEGLIAYGGDLSINRVLYAYNRGIFPWYNKGDPILWWSPNPRLILDIDELKISKSLSKTIKKEVFEIKFDTKFREVMIECSQNREGQNGSWINEELIDTFCELHKLGYTHSFETYYNDELVGGGYGLVVGNIFCGESMFAKKTDASKVAFFHLVQRLKKNGFS